MPTSAIHPASPGDTPVLDALAQTLNESLRIAMNSHRAGELAHAETLYRGILDVLPQHAQANYGLGRLAVHTGHAGEALPHFVAALKAEPDNANYQLGCIDALMQADQLDAARDLLDSALEQGLQGDVVDALARQLEVRLQIARSIRDTQARVASAPAPRSKARSNKAAGKAQPSARELARLMAFLGQDRHVEAQALARSLTLRFPRHGVAWKILGVLMVLEDDPQAALHPLETATRLLPQDAEARLNLGLTLASVGRMKEAEANCRQALEIDPAYAKVHCALGVLLQRQARFFEAELHYRRALEIDPAYVDAHLELGLVLKLMRRFAEAEASYRAALDIDPSKAEGHNRLGLLLLEQDRLTDAEATFRRAVAADPTLGYPYTNLGNALCAQGRQTEADVSYRRALQIRPNDSNSHSALLYSLTLGQSMGPEALFAEHRRFGAQVEVHSASWMPHARTPDPGRQLQVGFVSGDLYNHAVSSFLEPVLKQLAGDASLALHAYSTRCSAEDPTTQRLRGYVKHWHTVGGMDDAGLAAKVRSDGIDILIDLSGHTASNRLPVFARRPAPVQVSWMGYPGTTGLESMDYYLCDPFILPPGRFDSQFTEKLVYLPANAPFQPLADAPPVNDLPALRAGHMTFGSFNRLNKISRDVVALWAQLLRAVPTSRMVLGGLPREGEYETLLDWFDGEGIERHRLDLHQRSLMRHYLALHHQVDVCLDTFPYNGGTTSLHALWMGVPTLTLAGATMAGRAGVSVLGHVGLDEFVVQDAPAFAAQGASWANRLPELAQLRAGLRGRFEQSAIGQPSLIAAALERALRTMWQRWCAGLPATSFDAGRGEGGSA